jgi:hypothetical protein
VVDHTASHPGMGSSGFGKKKRSKNILDQLVESD